MIAITHVLGLDQAARSGWGLKPVAPNRFTSLPFLAHGVARCGRFDECTAVVRVALEAARDPRALLVMFEDHGSIPLTRGSRFDPDTGRKPYRGTPVILGIGAARGYWSAVLDAAGHPASRRDKVEPDMWRGRVLGSCSGNTEQLKRTAVLVAGKLVGRALNDDDEAEGVCIAEWASIDGVTRFERVIEQRRARARGTPEQLDLDDVFAADVVVREALSRAQHTGRRKPFRWRE